MRTPLLRKNFVLIVIGQIISLFGNAILRFALPLYLFDQTGSAALLGVVSACSIVPAILLTPVGGIIADRVNKRNIMVALDFSTAALVLGCSLALGRVGLVPLLLAVLMLLYGIQGAYQPAVQASMPLLAEGQTLVTANAVINMVSSLAGLVGPVFGGMVYSENNLLPILYIGAGCFVFSAVMELFIALPHQRRPKNQSALRTAAADMQESLRYIYRVKPVLGKITWIVMAFNLFLSSMLLIGMQVILRQTLAVDAVQYGFAQGALAVGGLLGGVLASVTGKTAQIRNAYRLLALCAAATLPIGLVLLGAPALVSYWVLVATGIVLMAFSTMFTVQVLSYVQMETPRALTGKVIACLIAMSMCAQPLGQALYGLLFETLPAAAVVLGAAVVAAGIALCSRAAFGGLEPAKQA